MNFGILVYKWQAIDVIGPLDLLSSSCKASLSYGKEHGAVTAETIERAPKFVFHTIGENLEPVKVFTSSITLTPSTTVEQCPELDYLLLGGPIPEGFQFPQAYIDFIKKHNAAGKTIFTTCTGASALATTGLLDGKNATVNHFCLDWVAKEYPKVRWTKDAQWVVDGNIWTSGGGVAGMDMFARWIQLNFGLDVLKGAAMGLDFEPRDVNGMFTVLPKRYDAQGNQISTHLFP